MLGLFPTLSAYQEWARVLGLILSLYRHTLPMNAAFTVFLAVS